MAANSYIAAKLLVVGEGIVIPKLNMQDVLAARVIYIQWRFLRAIHTGLSKQYLRSMIERYCQMM